MEIDQNKLIAKIIDLGRIKQKAFDYLANDDEMNNLSKHNPYFDSEHPIECLKLEELRWRLLKVEDIMAEIIEIIDQER